MLVRFFFCPGRARYPSKFFNNFFSCNIQGATNMGTPATSRARHQEFDIGAHGSRENYPDTPGRIVVPLTPPNTTDDSEEDSTVTPAQLQVRIKEAAATLRQLDSNTIHLAFAANSLTDELLLFQLGSSLREARIEAEFRAVKRSAPKASYAYLPFGIRLQLLWQIVRLGLHACNTKFHGIR